MNLPGEQGVLSGADSHVIMDYTPEYSSPAAPAATLMLWFFGALGLVGAGVVTIYGFSINCEDAGISCSVDAILLQSMGLLGMFFASLIVVAGFALKSKAAQKRREENYEAFMRDLEEERKARTVEEKSDEEDPDVRD